MLRLKPRLKARLLWFPLSVLGVLGAVAWCGVATATTIQALSERALTERVSAVVFGRIVTTKTVVGKTSGYIATEATLQVYRAVKGAKTGDVLRVQVPGGEARGLVAVVPGAPRLEADQLWVGFLTHHDGVFTPYGLSFGMLPVVQAGDRFLVSSNTDGLRPVSPSANDQVWVLVNEPLDRLFERLQGYLSPTDPSSPEGDLLDGGVCQ